MPSRNRSREAAKARQQTELETHGVDATNKNKNKNKDKKAKAKQKKKRPRSAAARRTGSDMTGSDAPRNADGGRKRPVKGGPMLDPSADERSEVRFVMPGDAVKAYLCPGCNRDIAPGVGHIVAVPPDAPDLRRHWHRGCWDHRHRRF